MRRRLRALTLFLLLIAVVLITIGGCSADSLVLGENHDIVNPNGARRAVIQVQGRAVEYWVARSPGAQAGEPAAVVLFFIGKGDRSDRWTTAVADSWGDKPVEVWGMNYPGSGGSQGPVRLSSVGPDAVGMFDAARIAFPGRPIFVQAGSFGTTAALSVAARRPVAGLVLQNPPALRQMIVGQFGWWNLWLVALPVSWQVPADLDSIANAGHASAPAVFLLAGNDDVVAPRYHWMVVNAYRGPRKVTVISGARHNDPLTREGAAALTDGRDWLWHLAGLQP